MKNLDFIYFENLKREIQEEYLKNNTPSDEEISKWKGIDIVYFQEELRKKAKGNISEKSFYTYFKTQPLEKLPRIDMLNLLSIYAGYESWYDFKKKKPYTEEADIKNINEKEISTKENIPLFRRYRIYIGLGILLILMLFFTLIFSDNWFKKTYQFCFTDADRGTAIHNTIDIKVFKENESPIHYRVKPKECFVISTKDKVLRMEISSPLYETVEIYRNLENAPEVENIALKPDDYALMLYYYSTKDTNNNSLEHIKNKQQKLNYLINEDALIYQVFDNEIYGIETLSKQKYIGLVTTPTQSLQNLKVLSTKIENGKIVSIKFKIESNEEK
ncbi:MAG: hypothetical protein Q4A00_03695 [Flavobacteriaceae bacterium]|nr:hypothetical protein [Flavobacteriaceae bacterium]